MKRLSLFGSIGFAACLGLNALTPVSATDFNPSYRYEGQPPNRLRGTAETNSNVSNEARVPWYEKLPELQTPIEQNRDWESSQLGPSSYSLRENVTPAYDDFNHVFVRQRQGPVVGEVESIPPGQHAFDSMIHTPDSYSAPQQTWVSKEVFGTTDAWGDRVRTRFGVGNAGCCPLWQGAIDFYYLRRTTTCPVTVLVDDTTRTFEEFNAQSLDFDHNLGYGVRLYRALGCGTSVGFGYFGLYDQGTATELTGDLAFVVPGFATGGNPASYNMDYQSQLQSFDINIRQDVCGRFGLLAGLRYINLNEDLLVSSQLGAVVTLQHYDIGVNNNLFGAQLGTDVCIARWGSFRLDALVRGGFYLNNASQTTSSALIGPAVTASKDSFAVAGDAGLYVTYCFTPNLSLRAGYQVLGLHGVALAPEQLQQSNLATGLAGIDTQGSAFYGGATLGLQYAW